MTSENILLVVFLLFEICWLFSCVFFVGKLSRITIFNGGSGGCYIGYIAADRKIFLILSREKGQSTLSDAGQRRKKRSFYTYTRYELFSANKKKGHCCLNKVCCVSFLAGGRQRQKKEINIENLPRSTSMVCLNVFRPLLILLPPVSYCVPVSLTVTEN